jgi:hypothetical protein
VTYNNNKGWIPPSWVFVGLRIHTLTGASCLAKSNISNKSADIGLSVGLCPRKTSALSEEKKKEKKEEKRREKNITPLLCAYGCAASAALWFV